MAPAKNIAWAKLARQSSSQTQLLCRQKRHSSLTKTRLKNGGFHSQMRPLANNPRKEIRARARGSDEARHKTCSHFHTATNMQKLDTRVFLRREIN